MSSQRYTPDFKDEAVRKITVRLMEDKDAEAFLRTVRDSIREVASADYPPNVIESWAPQLSDEGIAYTLANPENEIRIVAEIDGEIVGIGSTVLEKNQLRACYVAPQGLRQGVGTTIVKKLEEIARQQGVAHFKLYATITAEFFYNHLGYVSEQRILHQTSSGVEMEAVVMTKQL